MIGKIIEGRYVGSEIHKLPGHSALIIQTQDGEEIALSKNNIISMDDVSSRYPTYGNKVMMVMWNNFEISLLQFGSVTNNISKEVPQKNETSPIAETTAESSKNQKAWKEFDRQRKTKKTGKMRGFVVLGIVLIAVICFALVMAQRDTVAETPVQAIGACQEIMGLHESELTDKKMALFYDNLELLGIDSYSKQDLSIDEIEAIVAEYSFPEFYQFICDLSEFYNAHNRYLAYEDYENVVKQYLRVSDVKTYTVAELDLIESDDFYKQYPSAKPQPETTTVSGKFFEDGDDKVETETRENTSTVTYIGDFAIEKVSGYNYDEGVYEWRNGEFIDEPASWKKFEKEYLWYKGELVTSLGEPITIIKYNNETYVVGNYVGLEKIDGSTQNREQTETVAQPETAPPPTAEELAYAEAEQLLSNGETVKAAIAFGKLGNYMDARTRSFNLWSSLRSRSIIAEADADLYQKVFLGIKNDGTVMAHGTNQNGECAVEHWKNIVEVYTDGYISCGLQEDGTVVLSDITKLNSSNYGEAFKTKVESLQTWRNIEFLVVQEGGDRDFWGVTRNGRIYFAGLQDNKSLIEEILSWSNIVGFYDCYLGYDWENSIGLENYLGLCMDGTVVHAGENDDLKRTVESWTDIVKLKNVSGFIVAWKADGTVVTWNGPDSMSSKDLVNAVDVVGSSWFGYAVLHPDGTVSTFPGTNDSFTEANNWKDIQEIYFNFHLLGLRADGTVLTERGTEYQKYQPKSGEWTNIARLYADDMSVGIRYDGTVCVSEERYAYPLKSWTDIRTELKGLKPIVSSTEESQYNGSESGMAVSRPEQMPVESDAPVYYWNETTSLSLPLASVQITPRKVENVAGAKPAYAIEILCDSMTSKELMTFLIHSTDDWGFNRISLVERIQKVLDMYDDAYMDGTMLYCSMSGYGIEWTVSLGADDHPCGIIGLTTNKPNEFEAVLGMMPQDVVAQESQQIQQKKTVLEPRGFVMSVNDYSQHLNQYLPKVYSIENVTESGFDIMKDGTTFLEVGWTEGEEGYQDALYFYGDWGNIDSLFEEILNSMEAEITSEEIIRLKGKWAAAKSLGIGDGTAIGGKTGVISAYRSRNADRYFLHFNTLQFALGGTVQIG